MDKNRTAYHDMIASLILTIFTFRFRRNLIKSDGLLITDEALKEILNIIEQSIDETEQQIHEVYEQREKGDKKDA